MKRMFKVCRWVLSLCLVAGVWRCSAADDAASAILELSGVKGGLVVHLGCGDGQLTAALHRNDSFVVYGFDTDARKVEAARAHLQSLGLKGSVWVDQLSGKTLPLINNAANLVVAEELGGLSLDEVMRVLAPNGVACVKQGGAWQKTVKPWPSAIDEWTHYLHGPDNNAVAHDSLISAPRHMQWLASPMWTRNHHKLNSVSSVVTAKGRLFCIIDEAPAANLSVPGKWFVIARDAFSGVELWEKQLSSWTTHQVSFRSGPAQLPRLLVAAGERVYLPLGLNEPVSELDATTGKVLRTFEETKGAEEIIFTKDTLLVLKGEPVAEQAAANDAFKKLLASPNNKAIVAIDAKSGRTLWTWSRAGKRLMPETLAADGQRVCIQVDGGVACLDLASGKPLWSVDGRQLEAAEGKGKKGKKKAAFNFEFGKYTLVMQDGVVLCNLAERLTALSAETGKALWACPAGGGFHSPLDIFVINGLVWQGSHVKDSVAPSPVDDFNVGRDLHTGVIKQTNQVMVDLQTAGHHHRCYREKATDRFILGGKRGIELMDLAGNEHSRNNWLRGTCQYGILPANGLIYTPPHSCACYMESLLKGFWSFSSAQSKVTEAQAAAAKLERLERGEAFGKFSAAKAELADAGDWPQFRHDGLRSGGSQQELAAALAPVWKVSLGGPLTQPVIAAGKVVVADSANNSVCALDEASGKLAWKFACGGRVDSAPTVYGGLVLFGSSDGRVYCVRLEDGKLVWRFLAAAADLRAVSRERVESLWPVHGSVLMQDGVAYVAAGRSTWLDGGIDLYGLNPATGAVVYRHHFESKHPQYQEGKTHAKPEHDTALAQNLTDYKTFLEPDRSDAFSMAGGAISDVLVSDGRNVFLHQAMFNARLEPQPKLARHLLATSGLLDETDNHRGHWVLGTGDFSGLPVAYSWIVDSPERHGKSIAVPTGALLAFDAQAVWGLQRKGNSAGQYVLYRAANTPFSDQEKAQPDFRAGQTTASLWKQEVSLQPRALVKSGTRLCLGAAPADVPEEDPQAAYEGRRGGMIWLLSADNGTKLSEVRLEAPVVWDGLAVAHGRLYVSTTDGKLTCLAGK